MITLSSDFGPHYPAAMRGVLAQWTGARLLDVTHDLPRQNVPASAFWLRELLPYFPPAVHLAVIDPGVGTGRAAVVVRTDQRVVTRPDNGVLVPVARRLGDGSFEVFRIEVAEEPATDSDRTDWPPRPASATFHGRDVFAPAAGKVHELGVDAIEDTTGLVRTDTYETVRFPDPTVDEGSATGTVLAIDGFGNAITNVPGEALADALGTEVTVDGARVPLRKTYAAVDPGQRLVTVGSHGNVELAVNQGRGEDAFGLDAGERFTLSWG